MEAAKTHVKAVAAYVCDRVEEVVAFAMKANEDLQEWVCTLAESVGNTKAEAIAFWRRLRNDKELCLSGRRNVHTRSCISYALDGVNDSVHASAFIAEIILCIVFGIIGNDEHLIGNTDICPDFFGNEGHKGMDEFEYACENVKKHALGVLVIFASLIKESGLHNLDIPVAEYVPDEFVKLCSSNTELELIKVTRNFLNGCIEVGKNPLIFYLKLCGDFGLCIVIKIEKHESCRIPELICKVSGVIHLCGGESHIVTGCVTCNESKSESVRTVLGNNLEGINTVAEGL
jgi:hypothetical protein